MGGPPWVREWETEGDSRLRENEKAGNPFGLPASPYDYRERRGKMVCVAQALCLMSPSYPRQREKSTSFSDPSQFVYKQTNFGIFHLQFVQK